MTYIRGLRVARLYNNDIYVGLDSIVWDSIPVPYKRTWRKNINCVISITHRCLSSSNCPASEFKAFILCGIVCKQKWRFQLFNINVYTEINYLTRAVICSIVMFYTSSKCNQNLRQHEQRYALSSVFILVCDIYMMTSSNENIFRVTALGVIARG